jgi:hypothetical protein
MSQNDDKKTERDKLFAEQRALKDTIRGPSNLQVGRLTAQAPVVWRLPGLLRALCACVHTSPGPACAVHHHIQPALKNTTTTNPLHPQAVEEAIARMEYELTHESMSAEREKMLREKKERAEKNDRPTAMRLAQVCVRVCVSVWEGGWSGVHVACRRAQLLTATTDTQGPGAAASPTHCDRAPAVTTPHTRDTPTPTSTARHARRCLPGSMRPRPPATPSAPTSMC